MEEEAGEQNLEQGEAAEVAHERVLPDGRAEVPHANGLLYHEINEPMVPDDKRRMMLTCRERTWALMIKQRIEEIPELDNLPDFWYAQLAIMEHDRFDGAIERARHLQAFRNEYKIKDTFIEGSHVLEQLVSLFPRHYLCFVYSYNAYDITVDLKGFEMSLLNSEDRIRTWLCGYFYTCTCLCPDLDAIRRGVNAMVECNGYDWSTNIDFAASRRVVDEMLAQYPLKFQNAYFYHSGLAFNVLYGLMKRYIPKTWQQTFRVGCRGPNYLDEIHFDPNVEAANRCLLQNMENALERRYRKEQTFKLCE